MIYKKIAELCKQRGISISKLERDIGIGNGTVGRWVTSSPTVEKLMKVADYFGVSVDEILKG